MRMQVQSLTLLNGVRIHRAMSCSIGHRCGLDPALLWLWHKSAAVAPIRPLTSLCCGCSLKKTKKKKKDIQCNKLFYVYHWNLKCSWLLGFVTSSKMVYVWEKLEVMVTLVKVGRSEKHWISEQQDR